MTASDTSIKSKAEQPETKFDSSINDANRSKGTLVLLDLSGDKSAALEWAEREASGLQVRLLNKADLKWGSKREAIAKLRKLAPHTFAIFTSNLKAQGSQSLMMLFAAMTGARRIVLADTAGRRIARSQLKTFIIEAPRIMLEILFGYTVIVPLSLLLTWLLNALLLFRQAARSMNAYQRAGEIKVSPSNQAMTGRYAYWESEALLQDEGLRVLYVRATIGPATPSGGMASHVRGFAQGAAALGHRLHFFSSSSVGISPETCIEPSATINATRVLFEIWNNLVFTARALNLLKNTSEIDFIYQRYSRFNWTGVALSIAKGFPLLLEFNGSEVWVSRHWDPVGQLWLLKRFERLNLRGADLIFVVSDVQRRNLVEAGVEQSRICVNPNGVNPEEFHKGRGGKELRRALGVDDKIVVGFLGTFGPWHGAPVLAEAATLVAKSDRFHFLFVGDGDERGLTEERIESARGRLSATFTGRIAHDRAPDYLDACDILVSPHVRSTDGSEFFGSPTKLFEYMAMSLPVIASRVGQVAEVIKDGENGILVEANDARALAEAIERLADDDELRARLGRAARETVTSRYTWRHNAARVFSSIQIDRH